MRLVKFPTPTARFFILLVLAPLRAAVAEIGEVWLYEHLDFQGASYKISLDNHSERKVHTVDPSFFDRATSLKWSLGEGVALRLLVDNVNFDFDGRYKSFGLDLIESGELRDLRFSVDSPSPVTYSDAMSGFAWWTYDKELGYVDVFENTDYYALLPKKVFLSDWEPGSVVNMSSWSTLQDKISGMDYSHVCDVCTVSFFNDAEGKFGLFEASGWNTDERTPKLGGLDNTFSSFKWDFLRPRASKSDPITLKWKIPDVPTGGQTYYVSRSGINHGRDKGEEIITISETKARSYTFTTSMTRQVGLTLSAGLSATFGPVEATASVELTTSFENSVGQETTTAKEVGIEVTSTVTTPARASWTATFSATTGRASTTGTTQIHLWYHANIPGSVQDPGKNNWYKLTVPVAYSFDGDLFMKTKTELTQQYLDFTKCNKASDCRDPKTQKVGNIMYVTVRSKCTTKCVILDEQKLMKSQYGYECGKCPPSGRGLLG